MSKSEKNSLVSKRHAEVLNQFVSYDERPDLNLPDDVRKFLHQRFSECNKFLSLQLSTFPNLHEESLDHFLFLI
jgi:hypothetical protein